jgi:hypothetical protein
MAIAFAGVGLGEFFQRRRLHVLAEPIRRTGLFLPLLPLLAFWLREPAAQGWLGGPSVVGLINSLPAFHGAQAMLWLLFGLLYAWMAVTRRSFGYTLAAALAANVALWTLFQEQGWAFLAHPQLWLVPLALIVLASEAVNRGRLSRELATGLRYLGLGMLYLSSTADLFLARLSPGFALVLAFLAVLGVLAGIALRVRSYLYLGVGFLVLALFSMVWHAAVDLSQVWVWWLSGIGLGAAILVLFALFEKRRVRMLQVLDDLRTWQ